MFSYEKQRRRRGRGVIPLNREGDSSWELAKKKKNRLLGTSLVAAKGALSG